MDKRNERREQCGSCLRVWAEYRVADLFLLPFNVERANDAWGYDGSLCRRYAAMTTAFPPVKVRAVPGGLWVTDGGHRLAAARLRGDIWIPTVELPCE